MLRWSFIESGGSSIEINGIGSNTSGNVVDPGLGGFDIRAADQYATFENVEMGATSSTQQATIEMYVSDAVDTSNQTIFVTTVNDNTLDYNDGTPDGITPQQDKSWAFTTGDDGWEWWPFGSLTQPTHSAPGDTLDQTKTAAQALPVYGTWESPKNPTLGVTPKAGCVIRTRYSVSSSVNGEACPSIRMRNAWAHVMLYAGDWSVDFFNQDYNAFTIESIKTYDIPALGGYVDGREPTTTGTVYTTLFYPEQIATLTTGSTIIYVSFDLLDDDSISATGDAGTLSVTQVVVDGFDRPEYDAATSVPAINTTNFTNWSTNIQSIGAGSLTGVTCTAAAANVQIGCTTASSWYDASAVTGDADVFTLTSGDYYRLVFTLSSTATPGGDYGPTVRAGFVSTALIYGHDKELKGGGSNAILTSTPTEYETWVCAPSPASGSLTEDMRLRLESYLTTNADAITGKPCAGTVTLSDVYAESFDPAVIAP
jgi:hypothetical protein